MNSGPRLTNCGGHTSAETATVGRGLLLKSHDILKLPPRHGRFHGGGYYLYSHGLNWSQEDIAAVRVLAVDHADIDRVYPILGREPTAIVHKSAELGLKGFLSDQWCYVCNFRKTEKEKVRRKYHRKVCDLAYPYVVGKTTDSHALLIKIHDLVPKGLRSDLHADVCQDILVAVLEGQVTEDQIEDAIPYFLRGARKRYYMPWGTADILAPRYGDEGRTMIESIAGSEDVEWSQ